jgi:hypothetical protein
LLQDLGEFQDAIKKVLDTNDCSTEMTQLKRFLVPTTCVFDEVGKLNEKLEQSLILAGARSIAVSATEDGSQFKIYADGIISEEEFRIAFEEKFKSPPIHYEQHDAGKIEEESDSTIQMGDWTVAG